MKTFSEWIAATRIAIDFEEDCKIYVYHNTSKKFFTVSNLDSEPDRAMAVVMRELKSAYERDMSGRDPFTGINRNTEVVEAQGDPNKGATTIHATNR